MSTLVFMRVLESAPSRYDRGINILTFGKIPSLYEQLTTGIQEGDTVLDLGCGTGIISLFAAHRGARVKGIDINPEMLNIARERAELADMGDNIEYEEMGVAELDGEDDQDYNWIFAGMLFSELEKYEQDYVVEQVKRILKPRGKFVIIDEMRAENWFKRTLQNLIRIPLLVVTYILTQTTTGAVKGIEDRIESQGFVIIDQESYLWSSLIYLICENEE